MSKCSGLVELILERDRTNLERREALRKFSNLPDKGSVADSLIKRLPNEKDNLKRTWIISILAAINTPETIKHVVTHLDPKIEKYTYARYWAAVGLAKTSPPDLHHHLMRATKDPNSLVKAVAMRLLIENGYEDDYVNQLLAMIKSRDWQVRFNACRVLRRQAGHKPLKETVEEVFFPVLEKRLHAETEVMDVRRQAAMALGNMRHKNKEAIEALSKALERHLPDWTRRSCVDSLVQICRPETKNALLLALKDDDAEIRVRASYGLKDSLGKEGAVKFIVEEFLEQDTPDVKFFLDALRLIDKSGAANVLTEYLGHSDSKIRDRASFALVQLGGEEAVRTLQKKREEALNKYTELLKDADTNIMGQYNSLMKRAQKAFSMSMWMHTTIFSLGVLILVASLYVALSEGFGTFERYVGIGAAGGSLGTLLLMFYKGPLENIQKSVTSLVEVNVVFLGFVRQINQIDATFKQMFLALRGFGVEQMRQTVEQIQDSVKKTMEEVKAYMERTRKLDSNS